ncbi:hypothetical protein HPP92_005746 [Vanilla planifolia]|uniref:CSC1-like protein RXW8 n=1 Tax=Vanilla planifolia TaxID=51239 RepID=A0A835VDH4_VANPL|nr:hypothetical protein HPP92_005746 [Vanilla planifolia]
MSLCFSMLQPRMCWKKIDDGVRLVVYAVYLSLVEAIISLEIDSPLRRRIHVVIVPGEREMKLAALLTSAGINIGLCVLFISLYSVLRKQPANVYVYFGRRVTQERNKMNESFNFERFLPTPGWILKAWGPTENEILESAGLDAVVFLRLLVFRKSLHSLSPMMASRRFQAPKDNNGEKASKASWGFEKAKLTYQKTEQEYQSISKLRLEHVIACPPKPSHFTILVRSIPRSRDIPVDDVIKNFFITYHGMSYLSHQRIYRSGKFHKIMTNAEKVCRKFIRLRSISFDLKRRPVIHRCGLCGGTSRSFDLFSNVFDDDERRTPLNNSDNGKMEENCSAALVFFKTRYAAVVASRVLQSSNPMLWVTDLAPEPQDLYWSNLSIPYKQLWIRRISIVAATILFLFLFLIPVTFVQGLTQLETLEQRFPFLRGILTNKYMIQLVTGYLPSVILLLFFYCVPPTMMLFSSIEGAISRSSRKNSACCKVLYFTIWNIFFVNVLSASVLHQLMFISQPKDIPFTLARTLPGQATFFITYVLTSGWTSLCAELVQWFALTYNLVQKYVFRKMKEDPNLVPSFPYHTEVPRVLLFGLLGFTCSIMAPLILPFLMVYFLLGYLVYRNQILNVYRTKYESGGQLWPVVHNATIFSLVLAQIISLGVFGLKNSPIAASFAIPLVICTLLFHEYCRKRFLPIFKNFSAQALVKMDREDELSGRMEEIHRQLLTAYCQPAINNEGEGVERDRVESSGPLV